MLQNEFETSLEYAIDKFKNKNENNFEIEWKEPLDGNKKDNINIFEKEIIFEPYQCAPVYNRISREQVQEDDILFKNKKIKGIYKNAKGYVVVLYNDDTVSFSAWQKTIDGVLRKITINAEQKSNDSTMDNNIEQKLSDNNKKNKNFLFNVFLLSIFLFILLFFSSSRINA